MATNDRESKSAASWQYAPGTRAGLLIAVLGIAALAAAGQIVAVRAAGGGSDQALSFGIAVVGVLVVGHVTRSVPLGATYLRQGVGARFAAGVYVIAAVVALVAVVVKEVWLTGVCVGVLVLLATIVLVRRAPAQPGRH